ncbi:hypothetical protein [Streptomyces canus]|uniref:hypothetical protein n=1 Tax=Streptomyces canus TaxID=58343 RepID=UPI0027D88569|nr:hypothetical protein [Streptomyces canus]
MPSQRASRAEAVEQNQRADREREQERNDQAQQAKRDLYAHLNTTARAYRVAARDAVEAAQRGESVDPVLLDAAKESWADQYSQAQMALPKHVLQVASALNRALGSGTRSSSSCQAAPISMRHTSERRHGSAARCPMACISCGSR